MPSPARRVLRATGRRYRSMRLAALLLAALVVQIGCDKEEQPQETCEPSCARGSLPAGTYAVTYEDASGKTVTKNFRPDDTGFLAICQCKRILSDPVLLVGPPDCTRATASPATL